MELSPDCWLPSEEGKIKKREEMCIKERKERYQSREKNSLCVEIDFMCFLAGDSGALNKNLKRNF